MTLSGKVAVVTGAARGFGRAIAQGLIDEGAHVVALDRSWDTSETLAASPERLLQLEADVTDEAALERA